MVDVDSGGCLALFQTLLAERVLGDVSSAQPLPFLRLIYQLPLLASAFILVFFCFFLGFIDVSHDL